MDDYLSEKEQVEQMRAWWSDYGAYVIVGVVLGALALFGYNYYQSQQRNAEFAASELYDTLTNHVVDGNVDEAEAIVAELEADYGDLAYTSQARLAMARLYMDKNRDQDAADILRQLMESDARIEFRSVARLRLSKILLYQGKAEEVVELLGDNAGDTAFAARFSDALGDAYYELGDFEAARDAYSLALIEPSQSATVDQQFVQLKLLDLPAGTFISPDEEAGEEGAASDDMSDGAEATTENSAEDASEGDDGSAADDTAVDSADDESDDEGVE